MPLKPGYKTSEWLFAVLVSVGAVAAACVDVLPARWAVVAASVSTVAYSLSRGIAKGGAGGGA